MKMMNYSTSKLKILLEVEEGIDRINGDKKIKYLKT